MSKSLDVVILLDRSGSMASRKGDHEGGLRSFIEDQKKNSDSRLTLIQFDDQNVCEVVCNRTIITEVDTNSIYLTPRGGTPLFDAIMRATSFVSGQVGHDGSVLFMIITDGEENSSRETNKYTVQENIKSLEKDGWVFMYLGSNVDAYGEASNVGIGASNAINYASTPSNIRAAYAVASNKTDHANRGVKTAGHIQLPDMQYQTVEREALTSGADFTEDKMSFDALKNVVSNKTDTPTSSSNK